MKTNLILIILSFSFLVSCGEKKKKKEESIEKIVVTKNETIRVEVLTLKKRSFRSKATYPGIFREWDNFTIAPQFSGTIEYMPYKLNDYIKKGEVVVKINSSVLRAQIKQLKIAKKNIEISYDRVNKLYKKGLTTKTSLDAVTTQKENIDAQLNILNVNLKHSIIHSPFNGYLIKRWKKKGELAAPGMPIITVAELDRVKFIVSVPEKDISKLSKGDIIDIILEANNRSYQGVVYRIAQQSNPSSHTVAVELYLKNIKNFDNEFIFKLGMLGKASISLIRKNGFVIPLDSILKTEKGSFIFIVNNKIAKKVKIEIISTQNNMALVDGSIKENDKLITKGIYQLSSGSKVNIIKEEESKKNNNYKTFNFSCKKDKDSIKEIYKLIDLDLEIFDLFKDKEGYHLSYQGDLPKSIEKCKK